MHAVVLALLVAAQVVFAAASARAQDAAGEAAPAPGPCSVEYDSATIEMGQLAAPPDGEADERYEFVYDDQRRLVEVRGGPVGETPATTQRLQYDGLQQCADGAVIAAQLVDQAVTQSGCPALIESVSGGEVWLSEQLEYDAEGRLLTIEYGPSYPRRATVQRDASGQITALVGEDGAPVWTPAADEGLGRLHVERDDTGRIVRVETADPSLGEGPILVTTYQYGCWE